MGFWHTGYIEFHEPTGLVHDPGTVAQYPCAECDEVLFSIEELRHHRFERHPLRRPRLFIRGTEVGSHTMHIARAVAPGDIFFGTCDEAFLNERIVSRNDLPTALAGVTNDTCNLRLIKDGVTADFILEFRVASDRDIDGVERAFFQLASGRRLNTGLVSDFINSASAYPSAIRYGDGISSYLYGVLLREGSLDLQLPFEKYVDKFNSAAVVLTDYDRPLARMISGLIAFHFNQFPGVVSLAANTRVGLAASRFITLLDRTTIPFLNGDQPEEWETMITDLQTEQIVQWTVRPQLELLAQIKEMEHFLANDPAEVDRPKLHVLLGEAHKSVGNRAEARRHGAALRNIAVFEDWAEALIHNCS